MQHWSRSLLELYVGHTPHLQLRQASRHPNPRMPPQPLVDHRVAAPRADLQPRPFYEFVNQGSSRPYLLEPLKSRADLCTEVWALVRCVRRLVSHKCASSALTRSLLATPHRREQHLYHFYNLSVRKRKPAPPSSRLLALFHPPQMPRDVPPRHGVTQPSPTPADAGADRARDALGAYDPAPLLHARTGEPKTCVYGDKNMRLWR